MMLTVMNISKIYFITGVRQKGSQLVASESRRELRCRRVDTLTGVGGKKKGLRAA